MLKVILSALVSFGIGSIAFAQEPPAGAPPAQENAAPPAPKKEEPFVMEIISGTKKTEQKFATKDSGEGK